MRANYATIMARRLPLKVYVDLFLSFLALNMSSRVLLLVFAHEILRSTYNRISRGRRGFSKTEMEASKAKQSRARPGQSYSDLVRAVVKYVGKKKTRILLFLCHICTSAMHLRPHIQGQAGHVSQQRCQSKPFHVLSH